MKLTERGSYKYRLNASREWNVWHFGEEVVAFMVATNNVDGLKIDIRKTSVDDYKRTIPEVIAKVIIDERDAMRADSVTDLLRDAMKLLGLQAGIPLEGIVAMVQEAETFEHISRFIHRNHHIGLSVHEDSLNGALKKKIAEPEPEPEKTGWERFMDQVSQAMISVAQTATGTRPQPPIPTARIVKDK